MNAQRLTLVLLTASLAACATKTPPAVAPPATSSALEAARDALRGAQAAQAEERSPETYRRAIELLRQAETGKDASAREAAIRAEGLARLAAAEARCAQPKPAADPPADAASPERTQAELKQLREENRTLEERTALLQHALEQTEAELIRSRARLKGTETKAEATSAIAEARILMRRLSARSSAAALCRDALAEAERRLAANNYGAAMFFALKAQRIASQALASQPRP